jgi:hypothetical protein
MTMRVKLMALGLALVLLAGPLAPSSSAQQQPSEGSGTDGALLSDGTLAAVANVFGVPGKGIICILGSAFSLGVLLLTFGTQYGAAGEVFEEGCGGKWIVTGTDVRRQREASGALDWGTHRYD